MVEMGRGQELHSRACRGERLSDDELCELDTWYAEMDAEEARRLRQDAVESPTDEVLRDQIRERLTKLQATLEKISTIEESNAAIRQQNEELKRQLVSKGILAA